MRTCEIGRAGVIVIPLSRSTDRLREVRELIQGHSASTIHNWDSNLAHPNSNFRTLYTEAILLFGEAAHRKEPRVHLLPCICSLWRVTPCWLYLVGVHSVDWALSVGWTLLQWSLRLPLNLPGTHWSLVSVEEKTKAHTVEILPSLNLSPWQSGSRLLQGGWQWFNLWKTKTPTWVLWVYDSIFPGWLLN
jgi:hypothetical protein